MIDPHASEGAADRSSTTPVPAPPAAPDAATGHAPVDHVGRSGRSSLPPTWTTVVFTVLIGISPAMPHVTLAGGPLDVTDLPALLAAAVGAATVLRHGLWRDLTMRRAPEAYALALMVPFLLIAALHTGSFEAVATGPTRWALNAVLVALAYLLLRTTQDAQRMLRTLVGVGIVEAAFGIVVYVLRWQGVGITWGIMESGGAIGGIHVYGRITGTTAMSSTFIAGFFALVLPIAVALAMRAHQRTRAAWLVGAAIIFCGLVLTRSRMPIGLATLAVAVLLLATVRLRVWLPIAAAAVAVFLATPLRERMTNFHTDRLALWHVGWRIFTDHWLIGVGPGNYLDVLPRYQVPGHEVAAVTPHNSLLYVAAESGVLAAVALAVAIALSFRLLRSRDPFVLGPMLGLAAFMINAMTTNLYSIPSIAITAWMMAPCAMLLLQHRRRGATIDAPARPKAAHSKE